MTLYPIYSTVRDSYLLSLSDSFSFVLLRLPFFFVFFFFFFIFLLLRIQWQFEGSPKWRHRVIKNNTFVEFYYIFSCFICLYVCRYVGLCVQQVSANTIKKKKNLLKCLTNAYQPFSLKSFRSSHLRRTIMSSPAASGPATLEGYITVIELHHTNKHWIPA